MSQCNSARLMEEITNDGSSSTSDICSYLQDERLFEELLILTRSTH
jgi:hypothetical protein